jgi:hypothetical protein
VVFYILGQSGNAVLKRQASGLLDQARSLLGRLNGRPTFDRILDLVASPRCLCE